jgi:hypothetical protein
MTFRILHRYLGFFLAGIMIIYALSGITLVFRTTNTFKLIVNKTTEIETMLSAEDLGRAIRIKNLEVLNESNELITFKEGTYNKVTGVAEYTTYELPRWLDALTHFHKATTNDPLYYFNLFFGASLLFFAVSAFFMFLPKSPMFKKGLIYTAAGIALAIIMLIVG